jgi:hypothetical protein
VAKSGKRKVGKSHSSLGMMLYESFLMTNDFFLLGKRNNLTDIDNVNIPAYSTAIRKCWVRKNRVFPEIAGVAIHISLSAFLASR